jgi:hypothetical protein
MVTAKFRSVLLGTMTNYERFDERGILILRHDSSASPA